MQIVRNRLCDIRMRIADREGRLGELECCAAGHGMTAILIDSATAALELMCEHEARLESPIGSADSECQSPLAAAGTPPGALR